MHRITIVELEAHFNVGVTDEERAQPQRLLLTVDMDYDFSSAAVSDRITKTIDYYAVAQRLLKFGEGRSWKLIEKLANDLVDTILTEFQPEAVMVEVKKFAIPEARHVSVRLAKPRGTAVVKRAAWGIP
jgi:dihydroneopterin aldolase